MCTGRVRKFENFNPVSITKETSHDTCAYLKAILCHLDANYCLLHSKVDNKKHYEQDMK